MASVGPGSYVVVVLLVGGTTASYIILVLERELRYGKTWFLFNLTNKNQSTRPFVNYFRRPTLP
jgi:hypothetical protein